MKNAVLFLMVSCATACLPPGATMATEGTMRAPQGSTSGSAALAYTGDYGSTLAGGVRVSHQALRNLAIAGEAGVAGTVGSMGNGGLSGGGGRVSVRVSPDSDHFAVTGGLGGGAMAGGQGFLTADVGVRGGWNYQRRFELFAGESLTASVAVPAPVPSPMGPNVLDPAYFQSATEIGLLGRPTERLALGAVLDMFVSIGSSGRVLAGRPLFVPGIFATYTFGGN